MMKSFFRLSSFRRPHWVPTEPKLASVDPSTGARGELEGSEITDAEVGARRRA